VSFLSWLAKIFGFKEATPPEPPKEENVTIPKQESIPKMTAFDRAMKFVFKWEGGYSNHPSDPGGETNFGIAKRSHPDVDIKNLTEEGAKEIYRKAYWDKIKGDDLPEEVAVALMDYAVNSGVDRAAKAIQRLVHVGVDGQIGPNTISAVQTAATLLGNKRVAQNIVMERSDFLCGLVANKPEMAVFMKGWMRRTHSLMAEVASFVPGTTEEP